jgi:hypothetical protein
MQQCRADGLIDPDAIPGTNIHPAVVEDASRAFTKSGTAVASGGTAVKTKWGGLAGSYETPDSAQLLSVMDSVVTDTASLSATMTSVAKAISTYASAIEPVVAELKKIQGEARTFVAKALKGVTVGPWDPNHPANRGISGLIENFGQQLDHVHIPWDQYQPYIDDNNDLLTRVAAQETKLSAASADCVNAINGLRTDMCIAQVAGVDYTAAVKANQAMPWGTTGRGDQNCSQKFDSGMDDALQGTLDGLGGLIGYNAQTGKWGDGDWAGKSWLGFAESLGAIVLIGSPPVLLAAYLPKGWVPDVVRETALGIVDKQKQIVEGFVGTPEDWANDPAHAAGGLTFNVGTLFIPGAGEVGAGAKVASIAAKVGTIGADGSKLAAVTGKVAAAATTVVRVGSALDALRLGVSRGLVDAMQSVRTDLAKSLHSLADRIPAINVTVEQAAMPGGMHVGLGHPRIEVEPGGGGQWLHSVADHVQPAEARLGASPGTVHSASSSDVLSSGVPARDVPPLSGTERTLKVPFDDPMLRHSEIQANARYEIEDRDVVYHTDEHSRTVQADAVLHRVYDTDERPRSAGEQRRAGGSDRGSEDHGGHIIATMFGGSPNGLNIIAQHGRFVNLKEIGGVEKNIRDFLKAKPDSSIWMRQKIDYAGSSARPTAIRLEWGEVGSPNTYTKNIKNLITDKNGILGD